MLWGFYVRQLEEELSSVAWILAENAGPRLEGPAVDREGLRELTAQWDRHSRIRLVVADGRGVIRAATVQDLVGAPVSDERTPGLRQALEGQPNATVWKHPEYDYEDTMYVNVPIARNGSTVGALRVSFSLAQIEEKLSGLERTLLVTVGLYLGIVVGLTILLADTSTGRTMLHAGASSPPCRGWRPAAHEARSSWETSETYWRRAASSDWRRTAIWFIV